MEKRIVVILDLPGQEEISWLPEEVRLPAFHSRVFLALVRDSLMRLSLTTPQSTRLDPP